MFCDNSVFVAPRQDFTWLFDLPELRQRHFPILPPTHPDRPTHPGRLFAGRSLHSQHQQHHGVPWNVGETVNCSHSYPALRARNFPCLPLPCPAPRPCLCPPLPSPALPMMMMLMYSERGLAA
eukprot:2193024-Rhodomonas_salina.1